MVLSPKMLALHIILKLPKHFSMLLLNANNITRGFSAVICHFFLAILLEQNCRAWSRFPLKLIFNFHFTDLPLLCVAEFSIQSYFPYQHSLAAAERSEKTIGRTTCWPLKDIRLPYFSKIFHLFFYCISINFFYLWLNFIVVVSLNNLECAAWFF